MRHPSLSSSLPTRLAFSVSVLLVASLLLAPGAQAGISRAFRPATTMELAPGITYSKGTMRTARRLIQSVRVATVWPNNPSVRLRSLLSNDRVIRRELPSRIARRNSRSGPLAMVGTNGDFPTAQRVDAYAAPQSMAVSGGELQVAWACTRPTLGVDRAGWPHIDDVRVNITMRLPGRKVTKQVHRVNTHRDDRAVVLFTQRFGPTTQTAPGGVEVVLSLPDILRPSGVQEVRVTDVRRGGGNTPLGPGMAVLSRRAAGNDWVKDLRPGDRMTLQTSVVRNVNSRCSGRLEAAPGWEDIVEAVGGNHFTVRNGGVASPSRQLYPAGSERHPRTNVGVTADGRVLMVTVDGRQPGYSIGVKLAEMGRLMASLGAVTAFNLDGGGSTWMGRRFPGGRFKATNRPSDGRERLATQAIVAFYVPPGS